MCNIFIHSQSTFECFVFSSKTNSVVIRAMYLHSGIYSSGILVALNGKDHNVSCKVEYNNNNNDNNNNYYSYNNNSNNNDNDNNNDKNNDNNNNNYYYYNYLKNNNNNLI